mgnify:CR=1 FL=1
MRDMRALIQRVRWAKVEIAQKTVASISQGLLVLIGFSGLESASLPRTTVWAKFLGRTVNLRLFPDTQGKTNLSLEDVQGELLVVPQFTLYADCRRGNRPSFGQAAPPETAEWLFERFVADVQAMCSQRVDQGRFGADMDVSLCNWGPVTIWLDSEAMAA